jgi:hypothetical protein
LGIEEVPWTEGLTLVGHRAIGPVPGYLAPAVGEGLVWNWGGWDTARAHDWYLGTSQVGVLAKMRKS